MFADKLREEIDAAGLTVAQAAERVGVAPRLVYLWLSGTEPSRPKYDALLREFPSLLTAEKKNGRKR